MNGRTITISHLGRVEGHGGIYLRIAGDTVSEVNLDIYEGSRYYEALLRGKHFLEVQGIITRVCAICSSNHSVAALMAIEDALGITVTPRTHDLRGLLLLGAAIESHALHLFALALPDYFEADSVLALARSHPEQVAFGLRLKQLGNRIQAAIGGRAIHPINCLVGGFGSLPEREVLRKLRHDLGAALPALEGTVDLLASLDTPAWAAQPTLFLALKPFEEGFRFRGSAICTSEGGEYPLEAYRSVIHESLRLHSHAKHSTLSDGQTYMTGALARLKLWGHLLEGRARAAFLRLFPDGVQDNVLLNNAAQLVELLHCVERGAALIDRILEVPGDDETPVPYSPRAGVGLAGIEVPRGALFHEYELDGEGRVVRANVITPTAQNLANVEKDLRYATERILRTEPECPDAVIEGRLERVARAYDPCISCSVHLVRGEGR